MITNQQKQSLKNLGFTHIAFDEDGIGYAYWSKPIIKDDAAWLPTDPFEDILCLSMVGIIGDNGKSWRESLEEL